jgi:hypothetical protein
MILAYIVNVATSEAMRLLIALKWVQDLHISYVDFALDSKVVGDTNMFMINLSIINKCADRNT